MLPDGVYVHGPWLGVPEGGSLAPASEGSYGSEGGAPSVEGSPDDDELDDALDGSVPDEPDDELEDALDGSAPDEPDDELDDVDGSVPDELDDELDELDELVVPDEPPPLDTEDVPRPAMLGERRGEPAGARSTFVAPEPVSPPFSPAAGCPPVAGSEPQAQRRTAGTTSKKVFFFMLGGGA
jgi:hypothetical protein